MAGYCFTITSGRPVDVMASTVIPHMRELEAVSKLPVLFRFINARGTSGLQCTVMQYPVL